MSHKVADRTAAKVTASLVIHTNLDTLALGQVFHRVYRATREAAEAVSCGYPVDEAANGAADNVFRDLRSMLEQAYPWQEADGILSIVIDIVRDEVLALAAAAGQGGGR